MFQTRTTFFLLISSFTALACSASSARQVRDENTVVHADYLEIVSLAHKPDSEHSVPVADSDGKTWYRAEDVGADLSYFELDRTRVSPSWVRTPGAYLILLFIKEPYAERLRSWSRKHLEKPAGFLLGGKLRFVYTLHTPLSGPLVLQPFDTLDDALRVCAMVRAGGDPGRFDRQLVQVKEAFGRMRAKSKARRGDRPVDDVSSQDWAIVSLSKTRDEYHSQPIHGPEGGGWFRDPIAGLDSRSCDSSSLRGTLNADDGLRAVVKDSDIQSFSEWCKKRVGEQFGFVVDGQLLFVDEMQGSIVDRLHRLTLVLKSTQREGPVSATSAPSATVKPRVEFVITEEYLKAELIDPRYLRIVSLQRAVEGADTNGIRGPDGKAWRIREPVGLDLSHCDLSRTDITCSLAGEYRVFVQVSETHNQTFKNWCKKNMGEFVGVIINGRLIRVSRIETSLGGKLEIATYATEDAAIKERDIIRLGGMPDQ